MSITFYRNINRAGMDTTAEPTVEGQAATNSLTSSISAGGQAADLMDGNRHTLLSASPTTELVSNGGFDSTSNWTTPAEWTISGGKAHGNTSGGGGAAEMTQSSVVVVGFLYRVTYTVSDYVAGSVTAKLGIAGGTARGANGTFTEDIRAAGNTTLTFSAADLSDLKIDDVSIKSLDLRFELAANERVDSACLIVDNTDLWDAYPASARDVVDLYHHSSDDFATAKHLTPTKMYAGLLGVARPYLDFDGVDDKVTLTGQGNKLFQGHGSIVVEFSMQDLDGNQHIYGVAAPRIYIHTVGSVLRITLGDNVPHDVQTITADAIYHVVLTWDDPARTGDGSYTVVVDGALVDSGSYTGLTSIPANPTLGAVSSSNYANCRIYRHSAWNRVLSTAEALSLFNRTPIAAADQWPDNSELVTDVGFANWTGDDLDDWTVFGESGSDPEISEVATGEFHADAPTAGGSHCNIYTTSTYAGVRQSITTAVSKNHKIRTNIDGVSTGGLRVLDQLGSPKNYDETYTTAGIKVIDFVAQATSFKAEMSRQSGGATDDVTIKSVSIRQVGCVAEYAPDGIGKTAATWYDSSTNGLDGAITGADYRHTPAGSDRGFLLYEFAETNARYWFVEFNGGNLTAAANPKFGQLIIGKAFTPSASPDLEGNFGTGTGTVTRISYGGQKYVQRRFDPRYRRELAWSYISAADRAGFEALFADIGVAEEGPSLYALYYAEELAGQEPILRAARVMGRPTFTETAYGAWSLSLVLEDEV